MMNFSLDKVQELTDFFSEVVDGITNFFSSLYEFMCVLFPFFFDEHIQFLVTLCLCFVALIAYLLIRKVTV